MANQNDSGSEEDSVGLELSAKECDEKCKQFSEVSIEIFHIRR